MVSGISDGSIFLEPSQLNCLHWIPITFREFHLRCATQPEPEPHVNG